MEKWLFLKHCLQLICELFSFCAYLQSTTLDLIKIILKFVLEFVLPPGPVGHGL